MTPVLHLNASYLSEADAKSNRAIHFYHNKHNQGNFHHGLVLNFLTVIKHVTASESEAKIMSLCYDYHQAMPFLVAIDKMINPQPKHWIITGNYTRYQRKLPYGSASSRVTKFQTNFTSFGSMAQLIGLIAKLNICGPEICWIYVVNHDNPPHQSAWVVFPADILSNHFLS